ncbi:MAG: hypothetical protein HFH38_14910 [Lachnospiraceae bacterium]|jgi:arabinogalactan endo-1,4-beta-galactosidase|nr:hypothetical protein [Lachnospiraceae bacterium]
MKKQNGYLKRLYAILLAVFMVTTALPQPAAAAPAAGGNGRESTAGMALGSDISAAADADREYLDAKGQPRKLYDICKNDYGMNTVRLRTWLNHPKGSCKEDSIIAYAKKCHDAGLRVMLDFHYADNWADPGKQPPPSAWNVTDNISHEEAVRVGAELYNYTHSFLTHMIAEGVTPEWVQVGNEITNGMLWPLCNIANYDNFIYVLNQGIKAVRDASPTTKIVLHIDSGADTEMVTNWFQNAVNAGVTDFDVLGLSFYPRDHDPTVIIESLKNSFQSLYQKFCVGTNREIMVVEIGANYLENVTVNQKYNMIHNVVSALKEIPNGRGTGCIYWEIENYEMDKDQASGGRIPNRVWEAFSPNAAEINENPVTSLTLNGDAEITVQENDIHQLSLTVTPQQPDITRMVWTSSDPQVCSVNNAGLVKGLKAGESTLTVTNYGGKDGTYPTFSQSCKVTVIKEQPGLKNGGFELGDNGIWKYAEGNKGTGTLGTSANALNSTSSLHFTGGNGDLDFTFYQDIVGLKPGKYRLKGYVMGDPGVSTIRLFAKATEKEFTSEPYKTIGWGGSANFVEMVLDNIEVLDGKLQVGAHATATYSGNEAWGDFDNFSLELAEEYPTPPGGNENPGGNEDPGGNTNPGGNTPPPATIKAPVLSGIANTASGVKLSWKKSANAKGYQVFRKAGSGKWKRIAAISKQKTVSYTDKTAKNGILYAYRLKAVNGKNTSAYSKKTAKTVFLTKPKTQKPVNKSSRALTIKWKKNTKASGYQIQYAKNKSFKNAAKKNASSKKTALTLKKLAKKKTYYIRIRCYKKTGGKTYYSTWGNVQKIKIKK